MIKKPRGTRDLFGEDIQYFNQIREVVSEIATTYNIGEIRLPMFEELELYKRGTGETTDIVTKEIYQFFDKAQRELALRPEGTAGVMRSYIENKLYGDFSKTTKQFYLSEFFRYERPQNGRQRQFHQFGVEYLNVNSNEAIIEIFIQIKQILNELGIENVNFTINNLGKNFEREHYKKHLVNYFEQFKDNLCADCQSRLQNNPLRILDCKIDGNSEFIQNAPKISEFYQEETKQKYDDLLQSLEALNINYKIDDTMVRGLDYYSDIIFEVDSNSNTLLGGGCYNLLFEQLGGKKPLNAIGYAIGIERLIAYLKDLNIKPKINHKNVFILDKVQTKDSKIYVQKVATKLRTNKINVEFDLLDKSLKSLFKYTNSFNGDIVVINSEDILNNEISLFENNNNVKYTIEKFIKKVNNV